MSTQPQSPNAAQLISQGRDFALGFATLCILLFHQPFIKDALLILPFRIYGYWGVELFLFLSGFGIYYSLRKTGSSPLWGFYRKRLIRIMPTTMLAGCCFALCNPFLDGSLVSGKLPYGLTPIVCMLGLHLWYIRAILLFYLISPCLFRIIKRPILLVSVILLSCTIGLVGSMYFSPAKDHQIWASLIWPALRFPSYILGMIVADFCTTPGRKPRTQMIHRLALLLLALGCITAAAHCRLQAYAYHFFFLPPAAAVLCMAFGAFRRASFTHPIPAHLHHAICTVIEWIGKRSLEFYLLHWGIYHAIIHLHPEPSPLLLPLAWAVILLLILPLRAAAGRISAKLSGKPDTAPPAPNNHVA